MNRSPMIVAAAMSVVGFGCAAGPGARASAADTSVARAADQALADQTQAVTFAAEGLRLKGTLHVPGGPLAPRPGIVLIHGSGPQSRDAAVRGQLAMGFGFELKIFEGLAEALTRAGYVVLRYDKRTCGPFMVSALHGPIDRGIAQQLTWTEGLLEEAGMPLAAVQQQLGGLSQAVKDLAAMRTHSFNGTSIMGVPTGFWQSWMAQGDRAPAAVRTLKRPVLIIQGAYDWNVPVKEAEAWRASCAATDNVAPLCEVVVVPCVTHALNCVQEPNYRRIHPPDIGRNVHPAFVERMTAFLQKTTLSQP